MNTQNTRNYLKICACRNLRMTSRVITQYFDKALQPVGLRITQLALMADILFSEGITVGELADTQLMDQTTVTRNVEILRKSGFIDVKSGNDDSRKRCITITELGTAKLKAAVPFWEKAQQRIEDNIGSERYEEFLKTLSDIQRIV